MDQLNKAGPESHPAEAPKRRRGAQPGNSNARRKAKAEAAAQSLKVSKVSNLSEFPNSSKEEKPKRKRGAPKGNTNAKAEKKIAAAMAETQVKFEEPPKKKMGRPRTRPERDPGPFRVGRPPAIELNDETLRRLTLLAKLKSTREEAAAHFDVSPGTFDSFLQKHKKAEDTWTKGQFQFNTSLRSKMIQVADAGSVPMMIWLSKQFLGMKDKHEHSGDSSSPISHEFSMKKLTPKEAAEAYAELIRAH